MEIRRIAGCECIRPPKPTTPLRPIGNRRILNGLKGRLAQLARALRSHRRGRWFESNTAHYLPFRLILHLPEYHRFALYLQGFSPFQIFDVRIGAPGFRHRLQRILQRARRPVEVFVVEL